MADGDSTTAVASDGDVARGGIALGQGSPWLGADDVWGVGGAVGVVVGPMLGAGTRGGTAGGAKRGGDGNVAPGVTA
jgi:hypothetical protein